MQDFYGIEIRVHKSGNLWRYHYVNLPKFPVIKVSDKPRGSFSVAEYRDFVRLARQPIGEQVPEKFAKKY